MTTGKFHTCRNGYFSWYIYCFEDDGCSSHDTYFRIILAGKEEATVFAPAYPAFLTIQGKISYIHKLFEETIGGGVFTGRVG